MILSASQIESFRDDNPFGCEARWWFEKVDPARVSVIKDKALDIGDAVHKTLEAFLKGADQGVLHDIVLGARGALEFLIPLRKRVKHVELEFGPEPGQLAMVRIGGIDVRGKIDWLAMTPNWASDQYELGDHKTTSNIAKYGKTPGQIKKSVQMNVYAKWLETLHPFETLKVTQDFYQTKGRKFDVQSTTISKRENAESILSIEATVEKMVVASTLKSPESLKPNLKACHIGYGCPHRAHCPHVGVFNMASLLDAFSSLPTAAPPVPGNPASVLPPDAPKSDLASAAGKLKVDDTSLPPPKPTEEPAPATAEKPKRGPGRPKGSANQPEMPASTAVIAGMPGGVTITRVCVRHGAKIGLPNYSSAAVEVEMEAKVSEGMSVEAARETLSMNVKTAMVKELEIYLPKTAPVKP